MSLEGVRAGIILFLFMWFCMVGFWLLLADGQVYITGDREEDDKLEALNNRRVGRVRTAFWGGLALGAIALAVTFY